METALSWNTKLFALPTRLGGLGLSKPIEEAIHQHSFSMKITSALTSAIINQQPVYSFLIVNEQRQAKQATHLLRHLIHTTTANLSKSMQP